MFLFKVRVFILEMDASAAGIGREKFFLCKKRTVVIHLACFWRSQEQPPETVRVTLKAMQEFFYQHPPFVRGKFQRQRVRNSGAFQDKSM